MNSKILFSALILFLVFLSSGCTESQESNKELVKDGVRLTYENPGHGNTTFTFFNETEDTIKVREESGGVLSFYTAYKENLTTLGEKNLPIGSTNSYTQNRSEKERIKQVMENGGNTNIYRDSEKVLEVTRGEKLSFKGFEAYKVTFDSEDITFTNIVTAERPYLLLNSSSNLGPGTTLEKVERNVEINMSKYRNQKELNEEEEIPSNVKASATELEFSAVYSTENSEGERRLTFQVRNTGERDLNPANFKVTYKPDQNSEFKEFKALNDMWKTDSDTCEIYEGNLKPSGAFQCHTGLKFPGPEREVGIKIESTEFYYEKAYTCSPVTEGSMAC